jgi:hypothetical protein
MRGLAWLTFAAVMLSFASPARAVVPIGLNTCSTGCTTASNGSLVVDYTVPSDGQTYRWDLWSDASHPTAMITLAGPNDVNATARTSNGNGTTSFNPVFTLPDFTWNEVVTPGHTEITVFGPPSFNFCAGNTPAGTVCNVNNSIFGDSVFLNVANTSGPVSVTFSSIAIPEPATWSLLIGGFLALGWALRRRRSAAGLPV